MLFHSIGGRWPATTTHYNRSNISTTFSRFRIR